MYFNNGKVTGCLDRNSEANEDLMNVYIWIFLTKYLLQKTHFLGNSREKLITHFVTSLLHCGLDSFHYNKVIN
jgi:hypothetical protein